MMRWHLGSRCNSHASIQVGIHQLPVLLLQLLPGWLLLLPAHVLGRQLQMLLLLPLVLLRVFRWASMGKRWGPLSS